MANAMRKVGLRNLRAHKVRLALTVVSVLLGTAFVAGSFVFTDTLKRSFDTIFSSSDKGIDARVQPKHDYGRGVPIDVAAAVAKVPGVRAVEPSIDGDLVLVDSAGKKVSTGGAPSVGSDWNARARVHDAPKLLSGQAPRRAGEIAVNDGAAKKYHLTVGESVKVVVPNSAVTPARIVGIYDISFDTGGYLGALFSRAQAMSLFTDGHHYGAVDVAAARGVSQTALAARLRQALPADLEVKTGTQVRDDDSQGVASSLGFVNYILLGFGIVALLVGTFIIYNTFSMLVAQRQRELALLRAIGAGRKQVRRSVVLEASIIGVVGSALGLAGGVGLAYALHALLDAFNAGLPSGGLVLAPRTVIVTMLLGTIVTVLAAYTPARRAARIAPVAAMREDAVTPTASSLRRRTALGVLFAGGAVAITVAGASTDKTGDAASYTGLGLLATCIATLLLAPVFARWVIAPLGRVVGRPFGTVGQLARTNAVRNPRRTAATAFALTLGLVLVAGIAVVGASMKASTDKLFDSRVTADYVLTTDAAVAVPQEAAARAARVSGVASVTELQDFRVDIDGHQKLGTAVSGPLTAAIDMQMRHGSVETSGHRMIVAAKYARDRGWTLGSRHVLSTPGSKPITVTVGGIYANEDLLGPWLVGTDVYRALTPRDRWSDVVALVRMTKGANSAAVRAGLEKATNDFYVVDVRDREQFKGSLASQVNGLLGLLYGLLGLAIIIAILGIVNTLALSVIERRREIGMLRAVGMQRAQVRRTIYLESLLIAVFGAVLGVGLGLTYGSLFTHALRGEGFSVLQVPWGQAGLFLVLAAVVGVLAALWPAFRGARTPALEAIRTA